MHAYVCVSSQVPSRCVCVCVLLPKGRFRFVYYITDLRLSAVFSLQSFGSINRNVVLNGGLVYSMAFLGIAVIAGSLQFAQAFFLGVAGERLTKRLRLKAFQAMVKQDIEWFDDRRHAPGALTARLAVDATEVKGVSRRTPHSSARDTSSRLSW